MSDDEKIKEPYGIIAIMTQPNGHVIATSADFERQGYGGFELWEAQKIRARRSVMWKAVKAYCSDVVYDALGEYEVEKIAECLLRKGKHRIVCRAIGYSDDVVAEVERR